MLNISEKVVGITFMTTCITAPTLGIILGGFLASKSPSSEFSNLPMGICIFLATIALGFSLPIPFLKNIYIFAVFLWLVLFCGAAIMPILTGIIISSVPLNLRANGNSLSNFFANLIGYLPAPFVYGLISKYFKNDCPNLALSVTLFSTAIGIIFLLISNCFKSKIISEKNLEKSEHLEIMRKTSDLSRNASLLAACWGNQNIEYNFEEGNFENKIKEKRNHDYSMVSERKYKFTLENSKISKKYKNIEKFNQDFDQENLQEINLNNTFNDLEFMKLSHHNNNRMEYKSI